MLTAFSPLDSVGEEEQDEDNLAIKKARLYQGLEKFSQKLPFPFTGLAQFPPADLTFH